MKSFFAAAILAVAVFAQEDDTKDWTEDASVDDIQETTDLIGDVVDGLDGVAE